MLLSERESASTGWTPPGSAMVGQWDMVHEKTDLALQGPAAKK